MGITISTLQVYTELSAGYGLRTPAEVGRVGPHGVSQGARVKGTGKQSWSTGHSTRTQGLVQVGGTGLSGMVVYR